MFGFFRKKVNNAASLSGEQCNIDLSENGITINGVKLDVLVHIEAAETLLGEPRVVKLKTSSGCRKFLEGRYGEGMVTNRVNYTWDDLGIYCYTMNGKVISCFGFIFRRAPELHLEYTPAKMFSGTLTIGGEPWEQAVRRGEDCEFLRELRLGSYLVTAEYADPFSGSTPDEFGYNCVEIQLDG